MPEPKESESPSLVDTEKLLAAMRELLELKLSGFEDVVNLRFSKVDSAMIVLDDRLNTATTVQGEKVLLATTTLNARLEEMLHQTHKLEEARDTFVLRSENDQWKANIEQRLNTLHDFETMMKSKASQTSMYISYAITFGVLIISVISLIRSFVMP